MFCRVHVPTGTVICKATNTKNLQSRYGEQLGLTGEYEDREVAVRCMVGDTLAGETVTAKPDNYPQPSAEDAKAALVSLYAEKASLQAARDAALAVADADAVAAIDEKIAETAARAEAVGEAR